MIKKISEIKMTQTVATLKVFYRFEDMNYIVWEEQLKISYTRS